LGLAVDVVAATQQKEHRNGVCSPRRSPRRNPRRNPPRSAAGATPNAHALMGSVRGANGVECVLTDITHLIR